MAGVGTRGPMCQLERMIDVDPGTLWLGATPAPGVVGMSLLVNSSGARLLPLTPAQLKTIMPNVALRWRKKRPVWSVEQIVTELNRVFFAGEINTSRRRAAFLAQVAVETACFHEFEELASGDDYDPDVNPNKAKQLGNTASGDGKRYKGRGGFHLTGRYNYRIAGKSVGVDLERFPEKAAELGIGLDTALWFWNERHLSDLADADDFKTLTKRVNAGLLQYAERKVYYDRGVLTLGATLN